MEYKPVKEVRRKPYYKIAIWMIILFGWVLYFLADDSIGACYLFIGAILGLIDTIQEKEK